MTGPRDFSPKVKCQEWERAQGKCRALHDILSYDEETGVLTWKRRQPEMFSYLNDPSRECARWNARHAGKPAGTLDKTCGYIRVRIPKPMCAHKIIWAMKTGRWPTFDIDHANLDRADNRWANLRAATRRQNLANSRVRQTNASGLKGAFKTARGKFYSEIKIDGKRIHLGTFNTAAEASAAYEKVAIAHYGEFARMK